MRPTRRAVLGFGAAALAAGAAPRGAWSRTETDVLVIGAGLAGLVAARMIERAGGRAVLIEGSRRIGGRLHTLDALPGRPEAGGIQVGSGYRRLLALAAELGVGVVPGGAEARVGLYRINGATVAGRDWPASPANRLDAAERAIEPAMLLSHYARRLPPLAGIDAWQEAGAIAALDRPLGTMLAEAGASAEALRLIEANLNGNRLASLSALHAARTFAIYRASPGPTLVIAGGSQRLPEAMARALRAEPRLDHRVAALAEDAGGVTATLADGRRIRARQAICTIPLAALRGIGIEAAIDRATAATIAELPYTRASFAYLSATEPFWEGDGGGETLWTDVPLLGRVFVLGRSPAMLKVWTTGANADLLDRMPPAEAGRAIIAALEAARPAAKGKLAVARLLSWQTNPYARGIYHHLAPGQAVLLADAIADGRRTRLHFAGEHFAATASGMEGALESGEEAARRALAGL